MKVGGKRKEEKWKGGKEKGEKEKKENSRFPQLQDLKYLSNHKEISFSVETMGVFRTVLMTGSISNSCVCFWKCKQGVTLLDILRLCSLSPQNISKMPLHETLFILVSSLCLTGDVKTSVSPPCGEEGQWDVSSTHTPCYQHLYQWDQSLGRDAAVPEATHPLSSALPAEGNQPKKKIMAPSWWNEYYSFHTYSSRSPACHVFGFSKIQ